MDELKPKTELVMDPAKTDSLYLRARTVLDEVYEVMRRHNCLLAVKTIDTAAGPVHPLLIAEVRGDGKALVLCELRQITPEMIESRRLIFANGVIRDPAIY